MPIIERIVRLRDNLLYLLRPLWNLPALPETQDINQTDELRRQIEIDYWKGVATEIDEVYQRHFSKSGNNLGQEFIEEFRYLVMTALTTSQTEGALTITKKEIIVFTENVNESFDKVFAIWYTEGALKRMDASFDTTPALTIGEDLSPEDRRSISLSNAKSNILVILLALRVLKEGLNEIIRNHISIHSLKQDKIVETGTGDENDDQYIVSIQSDVLDTFYTILAHHFHKGQQEILKERLQGGVCGTDKLLFQQNGNKLADAFAVLIDNRLIAGNKTDLQKWIAKNFQYKHRNEVKDFTPKYLDDIISTTCKVCQNPLLAVERQKDGTLMVVAIKKP